MVVNQNVGLGILTLFCFLSCNKYEEVVLGIETHNKNEVVLDISETHKEIYGTYAGIVKCDTDNQYNSTQLLLLPNYTFEVYKHNIKGNKKSSKLKGTYTVVNDTLTLYHITYNHKYLIKDDEIHYTVKSNDTNIRFVEKCLQDILYKIR